MNCKKCSIDGSGCNLFDRRNFLRKSAGYIVGTSLLSGCSSILPMPTAKLEPMRPCGPASRYVPAIRVAFVRRKED